MIPKIFEKSKICNEFNTEENKKYFDFKQKKYVHNIDSFYFGILFDKIDEKLISILDENQMNCGFENCIPFSINNDFLILPTGVRFYRFILKKPNYYRILICPNPPNDSTPQFQIQINSEYIWLDGIEKCVDEILQEIVVLLNNFNMKIIKTTVNRVDFAWHSNYLKNMNKFNDLETVAKMKLTTLTRYDLEGIFVGKDNYECDYLRLGRLKSNNIIFRMYNKSKEIIEESKKFWFIPIWIETGLINIYDSFVYEELSKYSNWRMLDICRLKFYLEFGYDEFIKDEINSYIKQGELTGSYNYTAIEKLANELVPKVNIIVNNEFQIMRKFLSTCKFDNFNERNDLNAEIFVLLDNWKALTNNITYNVLRFVQYKGKIDENKSRRKLLPFWENLRNTKIYNVDKIIKNATLIREYNNNLNADIVKKRLISSVATLNIYNGYKYTGASDELSNVLNELNDNDFNSLKKFRIKKEKLLKIPLDKHCSNSKYLIVDTSTGEIKGEDEDNENK